MSTLEMIIMALENLGGKAALSDIYLEYENISNVSVTPGIKAGIRKNIEDHSSDSKNYKGREDIFYSVEGVGRGVWGLR